MSQNLAEKVNRQSGKDEVLGDLGSTTDKIINLLVASILTCEMVCSWRLFLALLLLITREVYTGVTVRLLQT